MLTAHVGLTENAIGKRDELHAELAEALKQEHGVGHATIQFEPLNARDEEKRA